jgi:Rad3-related DNA helicase
MKLLNKISEFLEILDLFHISEIEPESESLSAFSLSDKYIENNDLEFEEKEAKEKIKRINKKEEIDSFRFIISKDNKNNKNKLLFEIICLDASYGMKEYLKINPNSTVLTSGTLSLQSIENLLKVKFFKELKNNHVIKNDQFLINIINGYQINQKKYDYSFTYKNRDNKIQIKSLGNEIFNLVDSVKIGGVLVFFQSYEYLSKCYSIWLSEGLVKRYESNKKVIWSLIGGNESPSSLLL